MLALPNRSKFLIEVINASDDFFFHLFRELFLVGKNAALSDSIVGLLSLNYFKCLPNSIIDGILIPYHRCFFYSKIRRIFVFLLCPPFKATSIANVKPTTNYVDGSMHILYVRAHLGRFLPSNEISRSFYSLSIFVDIKCFPTNSIALYAYRIFIRHFMISPFFRLLHSFANEMLK